MKNIVAISRKIKVIYLIYGVARGGNREHKSKGSQPQSGVVRKGDREHRAEGG